MCRAGPLVVALLLADDFVEIGSSGRVFTKAAIIENLRHEAPVERSLTEFRAKPLADGVVLTTYRIAAQRLGDARPMCSLRSSIWRRQDGRWRMIFHQGTLANEK